MSTTKEEAINLITRLPDEASWDDVIVRDICEEED